MEFSDWLAGEVMVTTESDSEVLQRVAFIARKSDGGVERGNLEPVPEVDGRWKLATEAEWVKVHLVAMNVQGEVVEDLPPVELQDIAPSESRLVAPSVISQLIEEGESDETEFKSWLLIGSGGGRKGITKAVIAMANSSGGHLLLGVTDEGFLDGPEASRVGAIPDEVVEAARLVQDWITEGIEPSVIPQIAPVRLEGRFLLVVSVDRSEKRPHSNKGGTFYIRAGAESRPARRQDLLSICVDSSS